MAIREKDPELRKKRIGEAVAELEADLEKARREGNEELEKKIGQRRTYYQKQLAELQSKPPVSPPTAVPLTVPELFNQAAKMRADIAGGLAAMAGQGGWEDVRIGAFRISGTSQFLLSLALVFQVRSLSPERLEKYGPAATLALAGLSLWNDNKEVLAARDKKDTGGGAKPVGQDGAGGGEHSPNAKSIDSPPAKN